MGVVEFSPSKPLFPAQTIVLSVQLRFTEQKGTYSPRHFLHDGDDDDVQVDASIVVIRYVRRSLR